MTDAHRRESASRPVGAGMVVGNDNLRKLFAVRGLHASDFRRALTPSDLVQILNYSPRAVIALLRAFIAAERANQFDFDRWTASVQVIGRPYMVVPH
jgi:hypothetical protein